MGNVRTEGLKDHPVLDVTYTWRFFNTMSPLEIKLAAALSGIQTKATDQPFTYCELGCGNGLTANVLAGCFPHGDFYAVDMNPEHIGNGEQLAKKGKIRNITFLDATFEAMLGENLPQFDFIVLHGVYSWVSAEVRNDIRKVISKFLEPEGLAYISYNAMAGWSDLLPIRQFLCSLAETFEGNSCEKMSRALKELSYIRDQGAAYFQRVPRASGYLDSLMKQSQNYLVHEFFNDSWHPQYFSEVASEMAEIGLTYCANLERKKEPLLKKNVDKFPKVLELIDDPIALESLNSLILCENFRRDIFCSDQLFKRRAKTPALQDWVFGSSVVKSKKGQVLKASDPHLMRLVLPAVLSGDNTVGEILVRPEFKPFDPADVVALVGDLLIAGVIQPFLEKAPFIQKKINGNIQLACQHNRALLEERLFHSDTVFLAVPVLGNGLGLSSIHALLLLATDAVGLDGAVAWIWELMERKGHPMICDGQKIDSEVMLAKHLDREIEEFRTGWLPILSKLGVVVPAASQRRADNSLACPATPASA